MVYAWMEFGIHRSALSITVWIALYGVIVLKEIKFHIKEYHYANMESLYVMTNLFDSFYLRPYRRHVWYRVFVHDYCLKE
jgi:hypothetical protein